MFVTVITCSDPPRRQNQTVDIRSNVLFGKAIYACIAGFTAVGGVSVIGCQQNEIWTTATLLCDGMNTLTVSFLLLWRIVGFSGRAAIKE